MKSLRTFALVNPASANGRTGRRWPELAAHLRARVGDFEISFTEAPGQGSGIVRAALRAGAERIVSVGGDGTHNEVVNGFFEGADAVAPEAELVVVPTGTGGDFRRTLGLPADAVQAIDQIGERSAVVDVGHLRYTTHAGAEADRYFLNITSFGLGGLVDQVANSTTKAFGGRMSFLMAVGRATLRYKNQRVRMVLDGGAPITRTLVNGVIANARYFGGGMKIAPDADMADGLFDVVVVGDMGVLEMAGGLSKIYKGNHLGLDKVECFRAATVHAEAADPDTQVLLDMDGEQPGRLPATFKIVPAALRIGVGSEAQIGPSATVSDG